MKMTVASFSRRLFLLGLLAGTTTGCSSQAFDWKKPFNWTEAKVKESKYAPPTRLVAIWSQDVMHAAGQTPARGLGGRLYFYDEKSKAIPVEGQLVVYAYDDSKTVSTANREPDKKFAFTSEQFSKHFSPGELGASYSVWIPWDQNSNEQKQISLVPVFTSTTGHIVVGHQSTTVIPGNATGNAVANRIRYEKSTDPNLEIQQVSGVLSAEANRGSLGGNGRSTPTTTPPVAADRAPRETTIQLSRSLAQRVSQEPSPTPTSVPQPQIGQSTANNPIPTQMPRFSGPNPFTDNVQAPGYGQPLVTQGFSPSPVGVNEVVGEIPQTTQPATRSGPQQLQVRASQVVRPLPDPPHWKPNPSTQPFRHPSQPAR